MVLIELLSNPLGAVLFLVSIVISVTVHEFAHAKTADMLGDPTASSLGRVTLNPLAHLDPMGSIIFLIVGFGWGKPVPFDPYNLDNPRADSAKIALAGPASNFIMALLSSALLFLFTSSDLASVSIIGRVFLETFIWINIALGTFNLLPIAPLDGFKIVGGFLSDEQAEQWYSLERYGMIFLLFFILPLVGGRSMLEVVLLPLVRGIVTLLTPL